MRLKKNLDTIIKEKLFDEIVEGTPVLGEQISLEDIMERYEVSRTPVIQALKEFEALGVVTRTGKGHYYWQDFNDEQIKDIIDVRLLLELEGLDRIMKAGTAELAELEKTSEAALDYYRAGNTINTRRMDLKFHKQLVDLAESECLSDIYYRIQIKFMMVNYLLASHSAIEEKIACNDHTALVTSIRNQDSKKAEEIITKHISGAYKKIRSRVAEERLEA